MMAKKKNSIPSFWKNSITTLILLLTLLSSCSIQATINSIFDKHNSNIEQTAKPNKHKLNSNCKTTLGQECQNQSVEKNIISIAKLKIAIPVAILDNENDYFSSTLPFKFFKAFTSKYLNRNTTKYKTSIYIRLQNFRL
ncbi:MULTISPECIES: hypothetical protein [Myroides]|uniref:Lipoprotein n=1 Tax=Myroides albus TaxID=2562892 RepID=A0A6I3LQM0_9FLAO|nr:MULTISPECIES: hypothetical protein [Myroides]MTG98971.1 hypothetical protein [Myroides albus]MVX37331.1 hypothetical protein [Myroides sp. LoEW2-1]UVD80232.1 hypothetical protein NWE55_02815 [Myroides albus]